MVESFGWKVQFLGFVTVAEHRFRVFGVEVIFEGIHNGGVMEMADVMMLVPGRSVFKMCAMGGLFVPVVIGTWFAGVFCGLI